MATFGFQEYDVTSIMELSPTITDLVAYDLDLNTGRLEATRVLYFGRDQTGAWKPVIFGSKSNRLVFLDLPVPDLAYLGVLGRHDQTNNPEKIFRAKIIAAYPDYKFGGKTP